MLKRIIIVVLLTMPCCVPAEAQRSHVFWQNNVNLLTADTSEYISTIIGSKDGLPSPQVLCLYQQLDGHIWIGTSIGVSRFDGFNFDNFLTAGNRQLGKVHAVKEDTLNKVIWVMSDAGLSFFKGGVLLPAVFEEEHITVNDLCFDGKGGMWLATAKGPAHADVMAVREILSQQKVLLGARVLPAWRPLAQAGQMIRRVALDADGALWFSSLHLLFRHSRKGLEKIWDTSLESDDIASILCYSSSATYFTAIRSGLFKYENNRLEKVFFRKTISANLQQSGNSIYYLTIHGVYRFNALADSMQFISAIPEAQNIWLSCLLIDRENNLWIGMHDDLIFQKKKKFHECRNGDIAAGIELFSLFRKKDGVTLMGANRGRVFEKRGHRLVNHFGNNVSIAARAEVRAALEDNRGWMWYVSGFEGIRLMRGRNMKTITVKDGLGTNSNQFLLEDKSGNIWTGGDGCVTRITADSPTGKLSFSAYCKLFSGDNYNTFRNAVEGPDGAMWFGGEKGLFRLRGDSLEAYSLSRYIPHPLNISDITKDRRNNMWIATQGDGIWQFSFRHNSSLELKKVYTDRDALHSNTYLALLIDSSNIVWAAGYAGITRIDATTGQPDIANYNSADGYFNSNYQTIKLMQSGGDTVWAATSSGLLYFNPGHFTGTQTRPRIVLRNIELPGSPESGAFYYDERKKKLVLPHYHRSITFGFSGIYFTNPAALKYMYRLSGADNAWVDIGDKRSISFQHLAPGEYTLEVRSYLGNSAISEAIIYPFIILPPFWETWWFITSCFIAGVILLAVWARKREAVISRKAAAKALLQQQLNELEIKALRSQMNPHFIFNSLNAISLLIASNENGKALQYLSRFSKLLRMIVDENENSFTSLANEITLLHLYLQLEALRFGGTFSYSIHTDQALDQEEVMLPSFLINPLAENAIWHGLLHKDGERKLSIEFRQAAASQLQCIIQDNGIGITAARQLKAERLNGISRKEKGLRLIRDRLTALQEQTTQPVELHIEELQEGTKVTIELPIIYEKAVNKSVDH